MLCGTLSNLGGNAVLQCSQSNKLPPSDESSSSLVTRISLTNRKKTHIGEQSESLISAGEHSGLILQKVSDTLFLVLCSADPYRINRIMALSKGGLAGIILFLVLLHVGALLGYYFLMQRNPNRAPTIDINEKLQGLLR
jgi:hypothetical protein